MILVRNVFRLKFGKAKEAKALMKKGFQIAKKAGFAPDRLLSDLSGPFYTLVLENTYANLAGFEESQAKGFANREWEEWYQKLVPFVESGYREIFTIVKA
jgi:hypothetical protein